MGIEEIMNNKDEYVRFIDSIADLRGYYLNIMAVTDIINEGSYTFFD